MVAATQAGTPAIDQETFDRDGVLIWGPLLTSDELAQAQAALDQQFFTPADGAGPGTVAAGVRDLSEHRGQPLQYAMLQKVDLWRSDPVFAALVAQPAVVSRVEQLLGGPVRVFRDHAFYKPPNKGDDSRLALHQDNRYWHLEPPAAATVWIALDDATVANGCVHYVPGSHRRGRIEHVRMHPDAVVVEVIDAEPSVPYPVPAGHALIHHAQVLHGSPPNRTDRPRRAYCIVYMRADVCQRGESVSGYPLAAELANRLASGPREPR
jgi:2-oxoglutarate-dependent dioxygenase